MNPFVNFNQRGIDLPPGCKDLIDVLPKQAGSRFVNQQMPGLYLRDLELLISQLYEFKGTFRQLMIQSSTGAHICLVFTPSSKWMMFVLRPTENTLAEIVKATISAAGKAGISVGSVTLKQIADRPVVQCTLPATATETASLLSLLLQSVHQADRPFHVTQTSAP